MRGNVGAIREETCVQLAKYALFLHTRSMINSARSLVLMLLRASYRISSESAMHGLQCLHYTRDDLTEMQGKRMDLRLVKQS